MVWRWCNGHSWTFLGANQHTHKLNEDEFLKQIRHKFLKQIRHNLTRNFYNKRKKELNVVQLFVPQNWHILQNREGHNLPENVHEFRYKLKVKMNKIEC